MVASDPAAKIRELVSDIMYIIYLSIYISSLSLSVCFSLSRPLSLSLHCRSQFIQLSSQDMITDV
jgi:hypothetical protein